ncbi:MAG: tRNA modification GTPase [Planctomycetota bacterium]|jgi:tRNA modification GTPase
MAHPFLTSAVILAVASPPGRSVRGIIRTSGGAAFDLLRPHLDVGRHEGTWERGAYHARVHLGALDLPGIALIQPRPRSYTGEDNVELQLPGNPLLLERVIDAIVDSGLARGIETRRAEGGEFTARAFFNGKLTLTQAEGVAAIIAARTDAQLRAARLLRRGRLGSFAHGLAEALADALARVEAGIDFTDQEDVVTISPEALCVRMIPLRDRVEAQLRRSVGAERLEAIPWVVLTGRPNAGKSTLFNALLGRPRAVISEVAGTTRDVLTEPLSIDTPQGPAEVMLVDLAGAGPEASMLDRKMQSAARQAIARAELVLYCVPPEQSAGGSETRRPNEVLVRTKADLIGDGNRAGGLAVSAQTAQGLDELREVIARRLADRAVSLAADAMALQPRHEGGLRSAQLNLTEAIALAEASRLKRDLAQPELVAAAMRAALDDLSQLAGDITPDDVLGRIFSTFCVGK